jgi:phage protein D
MRPTFSISAAGKDISGDVSARLVSIEISDTVDETSDDMTIVLEDTAGTLAIPSSGATLDVSIGYDGRNTRLGSFVVDEVSVAGPPDLVTIRASSTPFVSDRKGGGSAEFNSRKSRSFEGKTIGDIVSTVARECGLTPVVDQSLKDVSIPHIAQVSETDANLLLRIARRYGAILKPAAGRLVLALEAGGQTTSGKPLEISLMPSDVSTYRFKLGGKMQGVTKVKAKVHSYSTGESEEVEVDVDKDGGQFLAPEGQTGEQVDAFYEKLLADSGGDIETTKQTAKSTAKRIARSKKQCDLTMLGNVSLVAGMHVNLTGFRQGNSGRYKVLTVRQSLSRSGWTTSLTCEGA